MFRKYTKQYNNYLHLCLFKIADKKNQVESNKKERWKLEIIWWIFTLVATFAIMLPIFHMAPTFPFKTHNIVYILMTITFTRYIFLLRHTPFAWSIPFKIVFPCSALIVIILLGDGLMELQRYLDEEGFIDFLGHLPGDQAMNMVKYIRSEYFFFGVASVICCVILPIRMIVSIYRQKNKGTV